MKTLYYFGISCEVESREVFLRILSVPRISTFMWCVVFFFAMVFGSIWFMDSHYYAAQFGAFFMKLLCMYLHFNVQSFRRFCFDMLHVIP